VCLDGATVSSGTTGPSGYIAGANFSVTEPGELVIVYYINKK